MLDERGNLIRDRLVVPFGADILQGLAVGSLQDDDVRRRAARNRLGAILVDKPGKRAGLTQQLGSAGGGPLLRGEDPDFSGMNRRGPVMQRPQGFGYDLRREPTDRH